MRDSRGYSLMELMVVLGILSIVSAIAAGGFIFYSPSSSDERGSLYDTLTRARNLASLNALCVEVKIIGTVVTTDGHMLPVASNTNCIDSSTGKLGTLVKSLPTLTLPTADKIVFSVPTVSIIFNSSGGLYIDQPISFVLTDRRGQNSIFKIYPAIGQIRTL